MLPQNAVKVIFGTGTIGDSSDPFAGFSTVEQTQEVFDIFRANGGNEIDSARGYPPNAPGTSEPLVGQTDVAQWALVSTKVESRPGDHTKAGIEKSINTSLEALKVPSLHIEWLHHPDPDTPLEETVAAMDTAYRAGKFKHFGISNYSIEQVHEIMAICDKQGYVKPSAYQGQYNAVARKAEDELLPLLRSHGIKFYAWSPAAGGFFNTNNKRSTGTDRAAQIFRNAYDKPEVLSAVQQVSDHAKKAGISGHAVALRWALHHSALSAEHGDAIVIGARTLDQMNSNMEILGAGPLPQDVSELVDGLWKTIEHVGPDFRPSYK